MKIKSFKENINLNVFHIKLIYFKMEDYYNKLIFVSQGSLRKLYGLKNKFLKLEQTKKNNEFKDFLIRNE